MNFKALAEKIGLEEDEYRELVELFIETGMADHDRLKTAFEAGDDQQLARIAHTIQGAAGNMGIMQVHEVAKRIELAAGENRMASVSAEVDSLKKLFDDVARFVRAPSISV
jgi:HPt (histidine-containing phosphotransfer) domain-containing protein